MGLTRIPTRTYWWVSQVGMLAGTCAYVYAGSEFPDLKTLEQKGAAGDLTPQLIIAFVILGLLPVTLKKVVAAVRSKSDNTAPPGNSVENP